MVGLRGGIKIIDRFRLNHTALIKIEKVGDEKERSEIGVENDSIATLFASWTNTIIRNIRKAVSLQKS